MLRLGGGRFVRAGQPDRHTGCTMREFRNPLKIFSPKKPKAQSSRPASVAPGADGDGAKPKKKKTRGVGTQRKTLLTAGSIAGAETPRKTLLGVS